MKIKTIRSLCSTLARSGLLVAWLAIPATTFAVQTDVAEEPATETAQEGDWREVIARYFEVTGGEEAHAAIKSVVAKGTISIPAAGISGDTTVTQKDKKGLMQMTLEGLGEFQTGTDGDIVWENSVMNGPKIHEGEQKRQSLMQFEISPLANLDKLFDTVEYGGMKEINGEQCHAVVGTNQGQQPTTFYFSKDSGLHVASHMTAVSDQGNIETLSLFSDFRDVEGVKFAFRTEAELPGGMKLITELESVEVNPEIDDSQFATPDEIKALLSEQGDDGN